MELPTKPFEVILTQPVAVPRRLRGVVHGAVGFDGKDEATRLGRVLGCEVDPVARGSNLAFEIEADRGQLRQDVALKGIEFNTWSVRGPRSVPPDSQYFT